MIDDATPEELEMDSDPIDNDPNFRIKDLKELLDDAQEENSSLTAIPQSRGSQRRPINSFQTVFFPKATGRSQNGKPGG